MGVRIAQAQNTGSSGRSPKTLSGSANRNQASRTWARPALKTRPSPNSSKAPLSREPKPARARGSRPREPFPAPDYPPSVEKRGRQTPYNRLSGVLRAAGETIISEYSISHRTLRPSAYTPKRWVDQESRED